MWNDMLTEHANNPFHVMIGGGDQIYNDKITEEKVVGSNIAPIDLNTEQEERPVAPEIAIAIDRFFFNNYVQVRLSVF